MTRHVGPSRRNLGPDPPRSNSRRITTLILLVVGDAARLVARAFEGLVEGGRRRDRHRLPLVLPPTVLGFYLLIALGPTGPAA